MLDSILSKVIKQSLHFLLNSVDQDHQIESYKMVESLTQFTLHEAKVWLFSHSVIMELPDHDTFQVLYVSNCSSLIPSDQAQLPA